MKKRGQAFLITAVIFIAIVSTLITIHNYSKKTTFSTFPYVAEEIQIESEKIMDYVLVSEDDVIDDFTKDVSNYAKKEGIDIYFITGKYPSIEFYNYVENNKNPLNVNIDNSNKLITATIGQSPNQENYEFTFYPEGKHFYFIMSKEKEVGGEKYVYTNA